MIERKASSQRARIVAIILLQGIGNELKAWGNRMEGCFQGGKNEFNV